MRLRRLSVATICGAERSRSKKKVALRTLKLAFMRYMGMHQAEMPTIHGQAPRRSILTALVTREVEL